MEQSDFDKLRPYNDSEAKSAITRVVDNVEFKKVLNYLYFNRNFDNVINSFKKIETVAEFQNKFSDYAVKKILKLTSKGLKISGLDNLDKTKPYLFIANHRDIVLDSAIMQVALLNNGHRTSQITFGSNLMTNEFIVDIGKLNKMFTFYRGGSKLRIYKNALLHSAYMKNVLVNENESVWIAQRDGRTKDGNDQTQKSLIKMLMAGRKDYLAALREFNVVPVTISYELEPCDYLKVHESHMSKLENYTKREGEDFNSVLTGIKGDKGEVNIVFGKPINDSLNDLEDVEFNDLAAMVCDEIDYQIHKSFVLQKGNYIAWDMLKNSENYLDDKYNQDDKYEFLKYVDNQLSKLKDESSELRELFIEMYANPVINYRGTIIN